jgi:predicted N-acetyltransferase YhbS
MTSRTPSRRTDEPQVVAPDRRRHTEGLVDLCSKVFSGGGSDYYGMRRFFLHDLKYAPYDWRCSRICLIGERVVTHWGVFGYRMRIGAARVRLAGVGGVATSAHHRKRGLMARTIRASIRAMAEVGYDMTMLFGIRHFYAQFGYVRAWSDSTYHVNVADLPADKPSGALRRFALRYRDDLAALYNRQHARATGTAVHPVRTRSFRRNQQGHLWTDARGRVRGYVHIAPGRDRLCCNEAVGDPEQVLRVMRRLARRAGKRAVAFECIPYDSPLARRLRWMDCRVETFHHRSSGPLIRTVRLAGTLGKLRVELLRRLKRSPMAGWRGELLIADTRERVTLAVGPRRIDVRPGRPSRHAVRGGDQIAQLLIGTDAPADVVEAGGIRLTGDARRLVGAMFPAQHPSLAGPDHY